MAFEVVSSYVSLFQSFDECGGHYHRVALRSTLCFYVNAFQAFSLKRFLRFFTGRYFTKIPADGDEKGEALTRKSTGWNEMQPCENGTPINRRAESPTRAD